MPPRKRAAAKPGAPGKQAKAAPRRVQPPDADDPDRARRAAKYAERMGSGAIRPPAPTRHCPTCTCGPK